VTRALGLAAVVTALLLVGCAGDGDATETETTPDSTELVAYFTRVGKVWPLRRVVAYTESVERAALDALIAGPTDQEFAELEIRHAIRSGADVQGLVIENGVARVEATDELREDGLAQIVFTLTRFPGIESVEIVTPGATRRLARSDFESLTPSILVESPLAYEEVTSPLRATGSANTFEANFGYELKDSTGRVVAEDFVTATSGTGTRGTFELEAPFSATENGLGTLVVYESSAKDGSRINVQEIPVRLST
jgi:germination protein M